MDIWTLLEQFEQRIPPESLICLGGVLLLAAWLLKTSLGRQALAQSRIRRHAMPLWTILPVFLIWTLPPMLMMGLIHPWLKNLENWQQAFAGNLIMSVSSLVTLLVVLFLGHQYYARRLKGFGLGINHLGQDLGAAVVNLLAVYPLVLVMIVVVTLVQQGKNGPDYQVQQHQELSYLVQFNHAPLTLSIVFLAVVLAPIVEELVFRGILQTTIRSIIDMPWLAIAFSSAAFAITHQNKEHWPSLFILGGAMGYAYEKSGSLWRAIFVHALFNGITILSYLTQPM